MENHHKSKTMRSPENTGLNTYKIIRKRYWEIIADNLSKAGMELGCVSAVDDREGRAEIRSNAAMIFARADFVNVHRKQ